MPPKENLVEVELKTVCDLYFRVQKTTPSPIEGVGVLIAVLTIIHQVAMPGMTKERFIAMVNELLESVDTQPKISSVDLEKMN